MIPLYDAPHQFEPLLPSDARQEPLLARAHDLARACAAPTAGVAASRELRGLLRAMNSYYSNRIEGQHTRPHELEQALRRDFSLSALLRRDLLKSDSPQGKVRFGLPLHALRFYFPALWPEAEADKQVV